MVHRASYVQDPSHTDSDSESEWPEPQSSIASGKEKKLHRMCNHLHCVHRQFQLTVHPRPPDL
jgi:hypothetical protein